MRVESSLQGFIFHFFPLLSCSGSSCITAHEVRQGGAEIPGSSGVCKGKNIAARLPLTNLLCVSCTDLGFIVIVSCRYFIKDTEQTVRESWNVWTLLYINHLESRDSERGPGGCDVRASLHPFPLLSHQDFRKSSPRALDSIPSGQVTENLCHMEGVREECLRQRGVSYAF